MDKIEFVCPKCGSHEVNIKGEQPFYDNPVIRDGVIVNTKAKGIEYYVTCKACGLYYTKKEYNKSPENLYKNNSNKEKILATEKKEEALSAPVESKKEPKLIAEDTQSITTPKKTTTKKANSSSKKTTTSTKKRTTKTVTASKE